MFDFESTHLDETGSESVGSGNLKDYRFDVIRRTKQDHRVGVGDEWMTPWRSHFFR